MAKLVVDKPLKPVELNDHLGIHFDSNGNCLPHSILGTLDEYLDQAAAYGKTIEIPSETDVTDVPKADIYLKPENNTECMPDNGSNALDHWRKKMIERKNVQKNISSNLLKDKLPPVPFRILVFLAFRYSIYHPILLMELRKNIIFSNFTMPFTIS